MILALTIYGGIVTITLAVLGWAYSRKVTEGDAAYAVIDAAVDAAEAQREDDFRKDTDQAIQQGYGRGAKPLTDDETARFEALKLTFRGATYNGPERAA